MDDWKRVCCMNIDDDDGTTEVDLITKYKSLLLIHKYLIQLMVGSIQNSPYESSIA